MFGNHPLPNIAPSLLCFLPPPTHIPPPPPSPLPLANAHTSQARARSSLTPTPTRCTNVTPTLPHHHPSTAPAFAPPLAEGCGQTTCHVTAQIPCRVARRQRRPPTATSPLKRLAYATSQPPTTPNHHLTTSNRRVCHVMDDDDPQPPPHPKAARMPRHGRRRPVEEA